ncbi:MAG: hypothetical protein DME09_21690 [Candidatus Rokuibacteriota bacterium]|nr:MAG: hypothetical protein DME09_21690 [Candidatus Rokubacteria bacterium]
MRRAPPAPAELTAMTSAELPVEVDRRPSPRRDALARGPLARTGDRPTASRLGRMLDGQVLKRSGA